MNTLKPGIETDILIAQHVFGFKVVKQDVLRFSEDGISGDYVQKDVYQIQAHIDPDTLELGPWQEDSKIGSYLTSDVPKYSSEIADTWLIIEKFEKIGVIDLGTYAGVWRCRIAVQDHPWTERFAEGSHESIKMAICLAALEIVRYRP